MAVVLDNTQGTSLGMAMVQHSMDNLVKQRMQMNDLYADANKAIAITQYSQAAETEREFIRQGVTPPKAYTIEKEQAKNKINSTRNMTANENRTIQESSPEFMRYYDIDSWDANRRRNTIDTGPSAFSRLGNAIGNVASKATSWVGNMMGGSNNTAPPATSPANATTSPPAGTPVNTGTGTTTTPTTAPPVTTNPTASMMNPTAAGIPADYGSVINIDDELKKLRINNSLGKIVPQSNGVQ